MKRFFSGLADVCYSMWIFNIVCDAVGWVVYGIVCLVSNSD